MKFLNMIRLGIYVILCICVSTYKNWKYIYISDVIDILQPELRILGTTALWE